jgi:hypothetical protein
MAVTLLPSKVRERAAGAIPERLAVVIRRGLCLGRPARRKPGPRCRGAQQIKTAQAASDQVQRGAAFLAPGFPGDESFGVSPGSRPIHTPGVM